MRVKIIAIILFAFSISTVYSQVPGYMGHRLLVSPIIGPILSIPFDTYSEDGTGGGGAKFKIKPKFGVALDFAYNRQRTIGVRYTYTKTDLSMPVFYKDIYQQGYPFLTAFYSPASVSCHSIGLRFTKYISGNIPAPLGMHWGVTAGLGIATFNDPKGVFPNYNNPKKGPYLTSILPDIIPYWGIRRGLGKRFMWSANVEFNFIALCYIGLNYDFEPYGNETLFGGYSTDNDIQAKPAGHFQHKVTKHTTAMAYYYSNLFGVSLELSFLPFKFILSNTSLLL